MERERRVRFDENIQIIRNDIHEDALCDSDDEYIILPILRNSHADPHDVDRLKSIDEEVNQGIDDLIQGDEFMILESDSHGNYSFTRRYFRMSKNRTELLYRRFSKIGHFHRIQLLGQYDYLHLGVNQLVLSKYDWKNCGGIAKPWYCITLSSTYRGDITLAFYNRKQYVKWALGLQSVLPLNHFHQSRAQINVGIMFYKISVLAQGAELDFDAIFYTLVHDSQTKSTDMGLLQFPFSCDDDSLIEILQKSNMNSRLI